MTSLKQILDSLEPLPEGPGWRGAIPDGWLQGRTAYGGLSAAIALHCAMNSDTDLPPLRSAQVSFVGPLAGPILVTAHRLRRGKNAAFIQADIESEVDYQTTTLPDFPRPGPEDTTYKGNPHVAFTRNFEFVDRREGPELKPAEWLRWTRLNERDGVDPMVELMAIGDCLPPAALRLLGRNAPMSSLTWIVNLLGATPTTEDGWWLLRSNSDYARAGSSSQVMGIWNATGEMVAEQMQSVALFA